MPVPAVPKYLAGQDLALASPGLRFGMYLPLWGVNNRTGKLLWTTHDVNYRVAGKDREEREYKDDNKAQALKQAVPLNPTDRSLLNALGSRQSALAQPLAAAGQLLSLGARAVAPFTTGLGNEHPLENGFAFLNPYGLPYLPGSGIKGVLRQAARELARGQWGDPQGWSEEPRYPLAVYGKPVLDSRKQPVTLSILDVLFGRETPAGESDHLRGALRFWDVIPQITGDSLMVEIMTPHQSHYYQCQWKKDRQGNEIGESPHESGQPTPISFLTVPPGSTLMFHVQCDEPFLARIAPELAERTRWQSVLRAAFEHAFAWLGFGAKTAVGYGAMERISDEDAAAARAAEERAQARCDWVDATVHELAAKHNAKAEDTLRGKALAEAWATLTDPQLKARALADIRARWQEKGWWDAPPGPASKKARAIYEPARSNGGS